jgi:hypothetical protein
MTGGVATCPTDGGKGVGGQGCEEVVVERSSVKLCNIESIGVVVEDACSTVVEWASFDAAVERK